MQDIPNKINDMFESMKSQRFTRHEPNPVQYVYNSEGEYVVVGDSNLSETTKRLNTSLKRSKTTNINLNKNNPFGDGDQTPILNKYKQQFLRLQSLEGGDIQECLQNQKLTPFAFLIIQGNKPGVVKMLSKVNGNAKRQLLERRETFLRYSPLHLAVIGARVVASGSALGSNTPDHVGVVRELLKAGARVDSKELTGKTVIHHCCAHLLCDATKDIARICVAEYKRLNLKDDNKDTITGLVDIPDRFLETAVHASIELPKTKEVLEFLIGELGANPLLKCGAGLTAFDAVKGNCLLTQIMSRGACKAAKVAYETSQGCSFCGKIPQSEGAKLLTCSRCKSVFYCNSACQKSHWPAHKKDCKKIRKEIKKISHIITPTNMEEGSFISISTGKGISKMWKGKPPKGMKYGDTFCVKIQTGQDCLIYNKSRSFLTCCTENNCTDYNALVKIIEEKGLVGGRKAYVDAIVTERGKLKVFPGTMSNHTW